MRSKPPATRAANFSACAESDLERNRQRTVIAENSSMALSGPNPKESRASEMGQGNVRLLSLADQHSSGRLAARNSSMVAWTLVGHVFGLVLWMAGLLMTTAVLVQYSQETSPKVRRTLARMGRICLRGLADPGAFLTLFAGIILVATNRAYYVHARWLHIKLVFVAVLIGAHGIVAMSNKSLVSERANFQRGHAKLLFGVILFVFLLILISTLPGEVFLK